MPAASGCTSGQRCGFFLKAAMNYAGTSGEHPPSRLRLRQRLRLAGSAATHRAMSPTPMAAPSGDEVFTEVVVVRHGETSGNTSRILQVGRPPSDSSPSFYWILQSTVVRTRGKLLTGYKHT